jgi:hypothetical protein
LGRLKGFLDGSKLGMKVDRKLPTFLRKKWKHNENIKWKRNFVKQKWKFFCRSENGTTFFGKTDAETKVYVSV